MATTIQQGLGKVEPVVSAAGVSIAYGERAARVLAVDDVSFDITTGERYAIIGPSGCGKTTLLMAIAGFLRPAAGILRTSGAEITGPGPDRAVVTEARPAASSEASTK